MSVTYVKFSKLPYMGQVSIETYLTKANRVVSTALDQFSTGNRMVPFLDSGLSSIFRVSDIRMALCATTAARRPPSGHAACWTSDGPIFD